MLLLFQNKIQLNRKTVDDIYRLAWDYWSNADMEFNDAEEAMGIRKILAHDMRMKKNPQGRHFLDF